MSRAMINPSHFLLHISVACVFFMLCMNTAVLSYGSEMEHVHSNLTMANRCIETERQALLLIKQGFVDIHGLLSSWGSPHEQDCCQWSGVGCDDRTGHVIHLSLSYVGYSLPFDDNGVTYPTLIVSTISPSLLELKHLNYLDLSWNNFGKLPIPKFVGSLPNLVYLDLSHAHFGGTIPDEVGNISRLNHLDLSSNSFDYTPIPKFIASITRLRYLGLSKNQFSGAIPLELGNLSRMNHLDLSNNFFDSSPIPKFIASFTSLTYLDLSYNQFTKAIPHELGNLYKLHHLDLGYNSALKGGNFGWIFHLFSLTHLDLSDINIGVPSLWEGLIQRLPSLSVLRLNNCNLTGSLPDITRFAFLRDLQVHSNQLNGYLPEHFEYNTPLQFMDLSNNFLRGSLPDFTGFSYLVNLYLNDNKFSGSIPDFTGCSSLQILLLGGNQFTEWETRSIGQLTTLNKLDLSRNSMGSTITESHLSNLSNLWYMNTSYNSLTFDLSSEWLPPFQISELSLASCKLGPKFPSWIRNQTKIHSLNFSNSQISDKIPMWFWNVSSTMDLLHLGSNKIRGKIPSMLFKFRDIDLSSNYFEGPVPLFSSLCSKINLSQNKFSGTLLSLHVVKDMSLSFLDLSHNLLSGALPDSWVYFQNLVFLNLGYNKFSGRIPPTMGHLVSLQTLIFRKNSLYGELPESLRNCSDLGFVDFGLNDLTGKVPAWIGEGLPKLYALILRSNKFYGSMPYYLCHLSNLHFLDLSINKISGNVPQCFDNLTAMIERGTEIAEHYYNSTYASAPTASTGSYFDHAYAAWKGQELEYGRNFAYLKMIDLSQNELTGGIPMGLTRLLDLKGLNLSRNKFYGELPQEIGRLKMLECLDLSRNKFSGKLPQSMSGLNYLGYLDLSYNNFSGKIPSGTQLQGFNVSAYEGNVGLCGPPLKKICPGDEADDDQPSSNGNEADEDEIEYRRLLYISGALGFSTTFWGICCTLLLHRRWRNAYFLFLENLKDRLYVIMAVRIARLRS